jgi:hypothetical protein
MAQALSARPLFEPRSVRMGFVADRASSFFSVNKIPPWLSIHIYHLQDGGRSSETLSHPIDVNNTTLSMYPAV